MLVYGPICRLRRKHSIVKAAPKPGALTVAFIGPDLRAILWFEVMLESDSLVHVLIGTWGRLKW
jgi:hypothetical protein